MLGPFSPHSDLRAVVARKIHDMRLTSAIVGMPAMKAYEPEPPFFFAWVRGKKLQVLLQSTTEYILSDLISINTLGLTRAFSKLDPPIGVT